MWFRQEDLLKILSWEAKSVPPLLLDFETHKCVMRQKVGELKVF